MKIKSKDLREGMWMLAESKIIGPYALLARAKSDDGWRVYDRFIGSCSIADESIDAVIADGQLSIMGHPANIGPLLQIAREKHNAPALHVSPRTTVAGRIIGWRCYRNRDLDDRVEWDADTEFGALMACLEGE